MRYVKIALLLIVVLPTAALMHYWLPSRDIVRLSGVDTKRMDVEDWWWWASKSKANEPGNTRDVSFINATWPDGDPRVYRNEDTGWGWPPYFKFDSLDLQADVQGMVQKPDGPKYVVVRHYGWRIPIWSVFPNALSVRPAEGPDEELFPWFNVIFLSGLAIGLITIWRFLQMVYRNRIDPAVAELEAETLGLGGRIRRWFRRLWIR